MVSTDSWTTGIPGAAVTFTGKTGHTFNGLTGTGGPFQLRVSRDSYVVTAKHNGSPIVPNAFNYENPDHVDLQPGTRAQVQFSLDRK